MTLIEIILWRIAVMSLGLPWVWPLMFVIILNISDLIKRIRGKSIDDEIWLDRFNEKLDGFNKKIALFIVPIWPYLTFPTLICLSIYKIFTSIMMADKVIFFLLAIFFFCTEIYLIKKEIQFKKTAQQ